MVFKASLFSVHHLHEMDTTKHSAGLLVLSGKAPHGNRNPPFSLRD